MNDRMTAGPAVRTPSPITTKMPVPMMAPTPIAVSWLALTDLFSACPDSCVSATSVETSWTANRLAFRLSACRPPADCAMGRPPGHARPQRQTDGKAAADWAQWRTQEATRTRSSMHLDDRRRYRSAELTHAREGHG